MRQSEFLQHQIQEAKEILFTLETPGWRHFLKTIIHPMEMNAFEKWKTIPVSDSENIIRLQISAQLADSIDDWINQVKSQIEKDSADLRAIQDGEEDDIELNKPSWKDNLVAKWKTLIERRNYHAVKSRPQNRRTRYGWS